MKGIYISLGSNLGNKKKNLESALKRLKKVAKIKKVSSLYKSDPWGDKYQDNFYNAVVEVEIDLEPLKLLAFLKGIEVELGRRKSRRWGPRIIDLDILLYGQEIINSPRLKIPHPELKNRMFVLVPLLELNPELADPLNEKKLLKYLNFSAPDAVVKIGKFNFEKWSWDEAV